MLELKIERYNKKNETRVCVTWTEFNEECKKIARWGDLKCLVVRYADGSELTLTPEDLQWGGQPKESLRIVR